MHPQPHNTQQNITSFNVGENQAILGVGLDQLQAAGVFYPDSGVETREALVSSSSIISYKFSNYFLPSMFVFNIIPVIWSPVFPLNI